LSEKYYDYYFKFPIEYCEICFDKIGMKALHEVSNFFDIFSQNIPLIGNKYFYHAYVILAIFTDDRKRWSSNAKYFLIEYGGYPSSEQEYKYYTKYEYGGEGGLRYTLLDNIYYNQLKQDDYIILEVNNVLSPRELIDLCKKDSKWTRAQYDLVNHNCQDFASLILKYLNCKRTINENNRGLHCMSKTKIPQPILKQLEKNENDKINKLLTFPIIGFVSDHIINLKRDIKFFSGERVDKRYLIYKPITECFWCGTEKEGNFTIKKIKDNETIEICIRCFCFVFNQDIEKAPTLHNHILKPTLKKSFFCLKCQKSFFYHVAYFCRFCNVSVCFTCFDKTFNISLDLKKNSISKDKNISFIDIKKYFNLDLFDDEIFSYLTKEDMKRCYDEYRIKYNCPVDISEEEFENSKNEYQKLMEEEEKKDEEIFSLLRSENFDIPILFSED